MEPCYICKNNPRSGTLSYCSSCYYQKYSKKYFQSEKGKNTLKKYMSSDSGKESLRKAVLKYNRKKNGFTEELFEERLSLQNNLCAICGSDKPSKSNKNDWHADHDHISGKPRGILCSGCNTLLGRIESVGFDWTDKAKQYLDKYSI